METTRSAYKEARQKVEEAREAAKRVAKDAFHEGASEIFKNYPEIDGFAVNAFTPYFNDGDTCTFGVSTDYFDVRLVDEDGWLISDDVDNGQEWNSTTKTMVQVRDPSPLLKAVSEIQTFLEEFSDEDYLSVFGDHVRIVVTRKGVETEDYSDHD